MWLLLQRLPRFWRMQISSEGSVSVNADSLSRWGPYRVSDHLENIHCLQADKDRSRHFREDLQRGEDIIWWNRIWVIGKTFCDISKSHYDVVNADNWDEIGRSIWSKCLKTHGQVVHQWFNQRKQDCSLFLRSLEDQRTQSACCFVQVKLRTECWVLNGFWEKISFRLLRFWNFHDDGKEISHACNSSGHNVGRDLVS